LKPRLDSLMQVARIGGMDTVMPPGGPGR